MVSKNTTQIRNPKKKEISSKELEALHDIADDVIESDFVPYACLFDPSTIVTKDGELLHTIKITGLGYDGQSHGDLRSAVRSAIRQCIPDDSYAIWLHTLRRKQGGLPRSHYPDPFSGKIDEAARMAQSTAVSYTNELYVSIVRASESSALLNKNVLLQSLFRKRDIASRSRGMEQGLAELSATSGKLIQALSSFGARLLTTVEREGVYYSEQLEFLEKLINLEERPMKVPERDLSHVLTSGEITFGFNAMEVRTEDGVRRFAAILTLKEYKESTLAGIDKFLEIPCELIVSQSFDFTGGGEAREAYEKQARYLTYSGDKELAKWIEIERLMNSNTLRDAKAFGEQQTTIFLISPGVNQLEANVRMVQRSLNRLGMLVIREDLRFEECYWSQLPANFTFITRKHSVDTDHLAGFVNLQAAPMGNASGSPWGPALTVFNTVQDTPYYFNLHRQNVAHTLVVGKPGTNHRTFAHFLLAQARKFPVNLWYLDATGKSVPFIESMNGTVYRPGTLNCKLNPFLLPQTPANREFLALWISTLVDPSGTQLNRSTLSFFQSAVDHIWQQPLEARRMATLAAYLREADSALGATIQRYVAGGAYGELFDMPQDEFTAGKLSTWDISQFMADPATRVPLTAYLLHRLTGSVNPNSPSIIALDEGIRILDTPLFSARVGGWCDYLAQNNSAAFILCETIEESAERAYTSVIANKAATIFAMPDKNPGVGYSMGFAFNPQEIATIGFIDAAEQQVLQKRGSEAVVVRAILNQLSPATTQILSGNPPIVTPSPEDVLASLMAGATQKVAG